MCHPPNQCTMKKKSHYIRLLQLPFLLALVLTLSLLVNSGCYYYKATARPGFTAEQLNKLLKENRYMILHSRESAWHLGLLRVHGDGFTGYLDKVDSARVKYLPVPKATWQSYPPKIPTKGGEVRVDRYKLRDKDIVIDQVHLFLADSLAPGVSVNNDISVPFSGILKTETYDRAKGMTTGSFVIPILFGTILGVAGIAVLIAALTSCPFIYVDTGQGFELAGEIFGGAVYPSLERHDYLSLPGIKTVDDSYRLKISNQLEEVQYINQAELWIVTHPENTMVLADRSGLLHQLDNPAIPVKALSAAGNDLIPLVNARDQQSFLFDEEPSATGDSNAFNAVTMTFAVPEGTHDGNLLVRCGNQLWGDYTYSQFMELFGKKYGKWSGILGKEPPEKNLQWQQDQRFVMMVYLKTTSGWRFIDYFNLIGTVGTREMVMPVDMSDALFTTGEDGKQTIRLRLESGFRFWELDYAALDLTTGSSFTVNRVSPLSALTETGKDVRMQLRENDDSYYIQEHTGEEATLVFPCIQGVAGMKQTIILHAKGYYKHVRNYPGKPDKATLVTFSEPGRLSRFSWEHYNLFNREQTEGGSLKVRP